MRAKAIAFDRIYRQLADEGKADEPGGAEYTRVKAEWKALGSPTPTAEWIHGRANAAYDALAWEKEKVIARIEAQH
jgi:hypothetical protein